MKTHFRQAGRTATRAFDFSGRASRAEFLTYLVLSQLPVLAIGIATAWLENDLVARAINLAVVALVTLPLFALCVRRFHDIGRSGWWSLPFLMLIARTLLLAVIGLTLGTTVREPIEAVLGYIDWLLTIPAVAGFVAMLVWPGQSGPGATNETTGTEGSVPVA